MTRQKKRPDGGNRQGAEIVNPVAEEREYPMKVTTPTAAQQSAVILMHPNHAGPKVVNPVMRGRKKGCLHFKAAWYQRRMAQQSAQLVAVSNDDSPALDVHRLAGYLAGSTSLGWAQAYKVAGTAMDSLAQKGV